MRTMRSIVLLLYLVSLVGTQNLDLKRQHIIGNKLKFIVSDESILNCKYILYRQPMTYIDAKAKCAKLRDANSRSGRGRIAVVRNRNDNEQLTSLLQHAFGYKLKVSYARKTDWIWIGQTLLNGRWLDEDEVDIPFKNWEQGQPDSRIEQGRSQNNIRLGKHGNWDDTFEDKQHPFVCTHTEHFMYSTSKVTWNNAVDYCAWGGMTLAHDMSPEENVAIVKLAQANSPVDTLGAQHPYLNRNWVWIGASDNHTEGVWRWSRGSKIYYSNWAKSQPDNLAEDYLENEVPGGQNFASISKITGEWDDSFLSRQREYVCMCSEHEFEGVGDLSDELSGMLNNQTESWALLKNRLDSEKDMEPGDPPFQCGDNRYIANSDRKRWYDAKDSCESRGMTLAKIDSLKQNYDAARQMFLMDPIDMGSMKQYYSDDNWFWIGLNDLEYENKFVWTDKTPVDYTNWGYQQPDNIRVPDYSMTGQHYVAVHKLLRYWDDSGDRELPYLCSCPGWDNEDDLPDMSTDAPTDSTGPTIPTGGKRFIYYSAPTTFWEAQSRCVNSGGNLACPSNVKQNEYVARIIRSNSWLGVLDYNVEGTFLCASSEQTAFTNWGDNQPDNTFEGQHDADFVIMKYPLADESPGKWYDYGAMVFLMDYKYSYVCESDCEEGEDGCIPNDPAKAQ